MTPMTPMIPQHQLQAGLDLVSLLRLVAQDPESIQSRISELAAAQGELVQERTRLAAEKLAAQGAAADAAKALEAVAVARAQLAGAEAAHAEAVAEFQAEAEHAKQLSEVQAKSLQDLAAEVDRKTAALVADREAWQKQKDADLAAFDEHAERQSEKLEELAQAAREQQLQAAQELANAMALKAEYEEKLERLKTAAAALA